LHIIFLNQDYIEEKEYDEIKDEKAQDSQVEIVDIPSQAIIIKIDSFPRWIIFFLVQKVNVITNQGLTPKSFL